MWSYLADAVRDALELAMPLVCGGCGAHGFGWCAGCATATGIPGGEPFEVVFPALETPVTAGGHGSPPRTWAAAPLIGPAARGIVAFKDHDRRDLASVFGIALRRSIGCAVAASHTARPRSDSAARHVLVVPVPSSRRARRRRGDVPVNGLATVALRDGGLRVSTTGAGTAAGPRATAERELRSRATSRVDTRLTWAPILTAARTVADQRSLDRERRLTNLRRSMRVEQACPSSPAMWPPVVVIDDVCTTGATLAEAARALRAAGAPSVWAAVVAATPMAGHQLP